jgi:acetyl-CoA acetyltransferase
MTVLLLPLLLLLLPGLWDPYSDVHMGDCAELCAEHYQISREAMDDHAIEAFERARAAAPYTRCGSNNSMLAAAVAA